MAYYNELLPVTDPKAIAEIIPRLDAHYGTKFPWQADPIREQLRRREQGPVYADWPTNNSLPKDVPLALPIRGGDRLEATTETLETGGKTIHNQRPQRSCGENEE